MQHKIKTGRLLLRQWTERDLEPFAAMGADAEVMRYFPATLDRHGSDAMGRRCQALIEERGWGFWAAEEVGTGEFIGFIGLHVPTAELPCSPCVEVGWRLARKHWGHGFATEGARACLAFAFSELQLSEVVAFTSIHNHRSQAVMQRLGMGRDRSNFKHPSLPDHHWLSEHCLYRLRRDVSG